MERLHFPQNCSYCCSAQSVAIIYNWENSLYGDQSINEYDLFRIFPKWESKLRKPIGLKGLKKYIDKLFKTRSTVYRGARELERNIEKGYYIILYIANLNNPKYGHYTPIMGHKCDRVLISESVLHEPLWYYLDVLKPRIKGYIKF